LVHSNPPLAASTLLFGIWSGWEMGLSSTIHWPLLTAAAAVSAAFALNLWWPGLHLVATLLTGWLIATGYVVKGDAGHWAVVVTGLAIAIAALVAAHRSRTAEALGAIACDVSAAVLGYAMIAAFAGLWALQFFERNHTAGLVLFAAGTVSLLIIAIYQGLKLGFRGAVWLGYAGFSAEIFALYVKTVGSLLGSSLFFLVAGLIVIALAAVAWRLHRIGGGETARGIRHD
jgi:uncharacterized membrane protein